MPWKRPHRWISFLLLTSMLCVGMAMGYVISRDGNGQSLTAVDIQLVGVCTGLAILASGFARMEYIARKTKHDLAGNQQAAGLAAEVAGQEVVAARDQLKKAVAEIPDKVVQKLNGGVDRAVVKALDASPFPTTHEQLEAFVKEVRGVDCERMIDAALERAYPRMLQAAREAGWRAPEH